MAKQKGYIIRLLSAEQGAALVLVALGLVVFLGCVSLVTDIGLLYSCKTHLVNTADAAALAGAQELPGDPDCAVVVAKEYALANGVSAGNLEVEVGSDLRSITVRPQQQVQFLFAQVLGFTTQEVSAAATAFAGPLSGVIGVVPFSIEEQELQYGREYVLKEGAGGAAEAGVDGRMHGWFGALDTDNTPGGGANEYREQVKLGYQEILRVGNQIPTETGNMSGPTVDGVQFRISQCKDGCTPENCKRDCPRLLIIPVIRVVDWYEITPKQVEIRGFAAFFVDGVEGQGNENYVVGRFIKSVYSGELGAGADYGSYAVKLIH